jgi:hypothetical protein
MRRHWGALAGLMHWRNLYRCRRDSALEQFVQLATVQPNASAGWAIVDLDTLALGHDERGVSAGGTFHDDAFEFGQTKHWFKAVADFSTAIFRVIGAGIYRSK